MQPIDPFANLILLDQMEEGIAYQLACDAGYDPEIHLNNLVGQREQALKAEVNEVIPQLWDNVNQAMALFTQLLEEARSHRPYRAANLQTAQIVENMETLKTHQIETQGILKTLHLHLQEVKAQQQAYQEKLMALKAAKRNQAAHNSLASFLCDCGERYRQTMVNQSADITYNTAFPPLSSSGGKVDCGGIGNHFPKIGGT